MSLSRIDFDYGKEKLLHQLSLEMEPGEKVALIGINGSGKTTLFSIISGSLTPDAGERHLTRRTRIAILPQETAAQGEGTLLEWVSGADKAFNAVQTELEEMQARLEGGEVFAGIELENYGDLQHRFEALGGYTHASTIEGALLGLGFQRPDFSKQVRVLSGGERRRAALAAVLVQGADLVLLDEPTNHLDLDALEWLQRFVLQSNSAMLVISHDRYFLDHTVTAVCHLVRSSVKRWKGNYTRFRQQYDEWILQEEAAYQKQQHEIRKTELFIRKNIAGQKTKQAKGRRKKLSRLERIERPREDRTNFRLGLEIKQRGGNVVLSAQKLSMTLGGRTLFHDLDFDLRRGDKVGIVGPNGAGKTTLLKILAGRLQPDAGSVSLGSAIDMGYFDQELDFVGNAPTVMDELWTVDNSFKEEQIRSYLGAFGFGEDFVDRPVRVLSGGQRNRLGLLKLVLEKHNLLALDEPTNHLDLDSVGFLESGLGRFSGTLVLVSHDRALLSRAIDTLIVLNHGEAQLFYGGYEQYIESLGGRPLWSELAEVASRKRPRKATPATSEESTQSNGDQNPSDPSPVAKWTNTSSGLGRTATPSEGEPIKVSKNMLANLKKKLERREAVIVSLEVDLEEIEEQLTQVNTLSSEEIVAISKQHAGTKQELQESYADWELLSQDLESKTLFLQQQTNTRMKPRDN